MRLALLSVTVAGVIAIQAAPAVPTRQEKLDPKRLELCLNGSPDDRRFSDIVSEPIKTLFANGATTPVDEVLCTSFSRQADEPALGWFRLNPSTPSRIEYIGKDFGHGEVRRLAPSPDGKYLAVAYSAEGHPTIEIVDLPALMRDKEYKPLSLVGAYPGYVSIDRWEAGALIVTSDMLLHGPVTRAGLLAEETFSMDVQSGKLKPLSDALNNPLQYFAAGLRDPDKSMRMAAVWGLRELDDQSAVPSLKQALTAEGDETVREEIRDLLKQLARAAELIGVCMSSNAETLQTKKIISEPIRAISLDGKTQAVDQAICVIPPDDKWGHQTWYRVDTSERRFRITSLKSSYDEVARLSASPNGKFLAAQFTGVSGTRLEIIDLAALMRNHEYRKIETIWGFRGSVSIQQWRDNDLHLTSDVFPDHIVSDKGEGDPVNLPLLSPETFVWRSETATIVPPSGALSDPIPYYCAGVAAAKTDGQRIALRGLSLMKDRAAIPCLESALANDTDAEMKAEIRKTIETILGK